MVPRLLLCAGIALLPACVRGQDLPADQPLTRKDFSELNNNLGELTKSIQQMKGDSEKRLTQLEEQVRVLSDYRGEDRAMLEQLAKMDKNGRSYVRLDTSHAPTRNELRRAVSASVPTYGVVTIVNKMGHDQTIAINGKTYDVIVDTDRDVRVPVGEFRVKLPNQQTLVRYVGLPHYQANVVIRPQYQWATPINVVTYSTPLTYITW